MEKVTTLAISGGSMSYADWNSIHSLKNLQTLEVAADVNAAQTQGKVPGHTFENMAFLETVSLNTASKEKAAGPRSTNEETEINYINGSAFKGCTSLTTVEIPGVWGISDYAFADCMALKSVTGPDLSIAGSYAFSGCKALQTAVFPELNSISIYAFANCTSLCTLKLPKVGYISGGCFQNCSNLEHIMLPASPPMLIGANPFDGVTLPPSAYTLVDGNMNPLKGDDLRESLRKYSRNSAWREILGLPDPDYKGKISFSAQINGDHIDTVSGDSMEACLDQMVAAYPGSSLSDIERIDGVLGTVTTEDWKIIENLTGIQGLNIGYFATPTKMEGAIPEGLKCQRV